MSKDDQKKKKPGFMQRLFSSKKLSVDEESPSGGQKNRKLQRMHTVDPASLSKALAAETKPTMTVKDDLAAANGKRAEPKVAGAKAKPKPKSKSRLNREGSAKARRKKKKKINEKIAIDVTKGLTFPCTPEVILEYHKRKPFLKPNEEWLMVELNEFECLVDSMNIIKIIAKHSKFFEVEPDELWEEFFEWVDDVPAYDEVINYDIWQEFRDKKYPM